jgi:hypothetical protein
MERNMYGVARDDDLPVRAQKEQNLCRLKMPPQSCRLEQLSTSSCLLTTLKRAYEAFFFCSILAMFTVLNEH